MLYGILLTLFIIACVSLIVLVLVQKGKGSMGLGNLGGGTQMLFGGSGGQDLFQKITWVLGACFMFGSIALGILKSSYLHDVRYIKVNEPKPVAKETVPPVESQAIPSEPSTAH